MDADFERFVEELKDRADLIEVIEATSEYRFERRQVGRYVKCVKPDSLNVDPAWGIYTWFAKAGTAGHQYETGDVFHWLERYAGMDFMQACEWLAQRYNVRMPERRQTPQQAEQAKAQKTRQETWEIACQWFERQLWASPEALDYCHRRGWTDETIRRARLGFAPGWEKAKDLMGDLSMYGVNMDAAATVAITGRRGGVAAWIQAQGIEDASKDWIENDHVPGLATGLRLVYPHLWRGRVVYFSARNLEWQDGKLVNRPELDENGNRRPKSYNLPRSLAGERQRYFGFGFTRGAEICLVVEGQPDAITASQLGFAPVALAGVAADDELAALLKRLEMKRIYVGLDNDKAGRENQLKTAALFGPMTRLVTWPENGIIITEAGKDDDIE